MKFRSIIRKSVVRLVVLALVILGAVSIVAAGFFYDNMVEVYKEVAGAHITTAMFNVSGSLIEELIANAERIKEISRIMEEDPEKAESLSAADRELFDRWDSINIHLMTTVLMNDNLDRFQIFVPEGDEAVCLLYQEKNEDCDGGILLRRKLRPDEKLAVEQIYTGTKYFTDMPIVRENGKLFGSMTTPVYDSEGNIVAVAELDITLGEIQEAILKLMLTIALIIAGILTITLLLYFRSVRGEMIIPILRMEEEASGIVDKLKNGGRVEKLDIHTGDEIESLAVSFEKMADNLRDYIDENTAITEKQALIRADLETAAHIQSDMLPKTFPAFPERTEFDLYASMTPAKEVGGDFYDYFLIDDHMLALVIADVSEKGVPASLFMMRCMLMIQSLAPEIRLPSSILGSLNNHICDNNDSAMFVTVWLGILDLETGMLKAANAGHEFPVIRKPDGCFEVFKDRHSFLVGGKKNIAYRDYELQLLPGTTLFLYTDGVPEARNAENEMYRLPALTDALNEAPDDSPEELVHRVGSSVKAFVKDAEQFDDLTMLCIRYNGAAGKENTEIRFGQELTVEASEENIDTVTRFLNDALASADWPVKIRKKIRLAAEEIYYNIASYAYAGGDVTVTGKDGGEIKNPVTVRLKITDRPAEAVFTFIDRGMPFDPLGNKDPDIHLEAKKRKVGGLGIYITKKIMDSVRYEYRDGQNILTLTKKTEELSH